MDTTLSALLLGLGRRTIQKVHEYRDADEIIKTKTLYLGNRFVKFEYKESSITFTAESTHVEKEEWHWKNQYDFLENEIKQLQEYAGCIEEISKKGIVSQGQAEHILSRFVQSLSWKVVDSDVIDDELIVDLIATFINDLNEGLVDWELKVYLSCVWLAEEKYELDNGMVLRRPKPSDLESEEMMDIIPLHGPLQHLFLGTHPSAVLEFVYRGRESIEYQKEIELILDIFRLFRLGSVTAIVTESSPKSLVKIGGTASSGRMPSRHYRYVLREEDIDSLQSFFRIMRKVLSPDPALEIADTLDPTDIAFMRYKDALFQAMAPDNRLTSAITCLEALYLKAKEREELSRRLSQRAATLLRMFGFNSLEVYNKLLQGYDIRSTFIHGSHIEKERQQSVKKLCEDILEYARVSLVVHYQLKNKIEKDNLINRMDNSLLDEGAQQKLKKLVEEGIIVTK
jgi:hypothetical protein